MLKVLITGCDGYIARNLADRFPYYDLTLTNRKNLDLLDHVQVKNFFADKYFDVVIHTATSGGSRLKEDGAEVFYENCLMHQNILENSQSFDKYISFGSGAELDRGYNIDSSADLRSAFPIDPYGMSKNYIAKSGLMYPNFNNIRIFNVFNHDELATRMIKNNIINYIKKQSITIHQNKFMDFFYMDDLCKVVKFVIDSNHQQKNINCSYMNKFSLYNIAQIINNLSDYKVDIVLENDQLGLNYFGDYNLHLFNIELTGLHLGIVKTYEEILKEYS
jgi:nucleoside-diphosphate-sugar epimerase